MACIMRINAGLISLKCSFSLLLWWLSLITSTNMRVGGGRRRWDVAWNM